MTLLPKHSGLRWIVLLYFSAPFHPFPECDLLIMGASAADSIGRDVQSYG